MFGSTAANGFSSCLKQASLNQGETLHSLRAGCAITPALPGSGLADVTSLIG